MIISHLLNQVYISFDFMCDPQYNHVLICKQPALDILVDKQPMNNKNCQGIYSTANDLNWHALFTTQRTQKLLIYTDAENFAQIYVSFLKTLNPSIKKTAAVKIIEIVLKRIEFIIGPRTEKYRPEIKSLIKKQTHNAANDVRKSIDSAWTMSKPFDVSTQFLYQTLGIEFLLAQFWASGMHELTIKKRLEHMWWKCFFCWAKELHKWYWANWCFETSQTKKNQMLEDLHNNPDMWWLLDPAITSQNVEQFKLNNDWSTVEKIFHHLVHNRQNRTMIELVAQWQNIVDKNWAIVLNQNNPLNLLATFTEPPYYDLVNSWLISYFAVQDTSTLKEMFV